MIEEHSFYPNRQMREHHAGGITLTLDANGWFSALNSTSYKFLVMAHRRKVIRLTSIPTIFIVVEGLF